MYGGTDVAVCQSLTSNSASTGSITDQPKCGLWRRKSQRGALRFSFYQSVRFHIALWLFDCYWKSVSDTCPGNDSAVPGIKYQEILTLYSPVVTICTAQCSLYVPHSGHYMYHQFNIQQFYVLPPQNIYVFCVDLRKTAIISLYNINW